MRSLLLTSWRAVNTGLGQTTICSHLSNTARRIPARQAISQVIAGRKPPIHLYTATRSNTFWYIAVRQKRAFSTVRKAQTVGAFLPATMFGLSAGSLGYSLVLSGLVCLGTNTVGFLVAMVTKTHKITDLIGCGTFGVAAWATQIAAMRGQDLSVVSYQRPLFITIAATFWSVRLAGFLFYRILQTGTDKRLDRFYNEDGEPWLTGPARFPLYLLGFWSVQALWAWSVLLPVTVAQAVQPRAAMGAWGWTGFALTMFFWAYEATADFQKDWFKRQPGNKGEFMRTGLYYFSQFPNYFAEIAFWWAMCLWCGLPHVLASHPWILVSPVFTTLLLRFGSGVANLAPSQRERYGDREDYRAYVASTPLLLPFMKPFYAGRGAEDAPEAMMNASGDVESPAGGKETHTDES